LQRVTSSPPNLASSSPQLQRVTSSPPNLGSSSPQLQRVTSTPPEFGSSSSFTTNDNSRPQFIRALSTPSTDSIGRGSPGSAEKRKSLNPKNRRLVHHLQSKHLQNLQNLVHVELR